MASSSWLPAPSAGDGGRPAPRDGGAPRDDGRPAGFGNTLRLRDEARDAWGWRWLDDLAQDTRFAWRTLRRSPGFTLTAIITLAFGIGVNIGMLRVVNGLLLRPLYERPEQILEVHARSTKPDGGASRPLLSELPRSP
jgi:hypothetical protein